MCRNFGLIKNQFPLGGTLKVLYRFRLMSSPRLFRGDYGLKNFSVILIFLIPRVSHLIRVNRLIIVIIVIGLRLLLRRGLSGFGRFSGVIPLVSLILMVV